MPVALLPKFLALPVQEGFEVAGLAFVMDLREQGFLSQYQEVIDSLRAKGYFLELIYLEANEEIILRRYSQTRRQHPLSKETGLMAGIRAEIHQLQNLRAAADRIIDTSGLNVHELKRLIRDIAQHDGRTTAMQILVKSFGFKYGPPKDADLVIDVRFLANPYFVPELKLLDGESEAIKKYVLDREATRQFLSKYIELLDFLIPLYQKEGKAYLTLAVGCTGGRHRSVAIARTLYEHLQQGGQPIKLIHRDIDQTAS